MAQNAEANDLQRLLRLIAHYTDYPGTWGGLTSLFLAGRTPPSPPVVAGMGMFNETLFNVPWENVPLPVSLMVDTAGMSSFNAVLFNAVEFNQTEESSQGGSYFYLFDQSANTRHLVDGSESVTDSELYRAFGEQVTHTGNTRNPYRFQGEVGPYTGAINRVWMRARIYDPVIRQWYSADPIGFGGRDWNLYRFVGNNPINFLDPQGLDWKYTGAFVAWYYTRKGETMYLRDRLNKRYFNHPSFRSEKNKWIENLKNHVKYVISLREKVLGAKVARMQDFQGQLTYRGSTNVTWDDELFAIGKSLPMSSFGFLIYWDSSCKKYRVEVSAHYLLKDRFVEPLKFGNYGYSGEVGGTPYDIIAEKKESFRFWIK